MVGSFLSVQAYKLSNFHFHKNLHNQLQTFIYMYKCQILLTNCFTEITAFSITGIQIFADMYYTIKFNTAQQCEVEIASILFNKLKVF